MIKNYLQLALKVLRRKPFYTFISLFGISFTLMILMLITSMFDGMIGANAPVSERDRMVLLPSMERIHYERDTTRIIDSIRMDDGTMRYDTSYAKLDNEDGNSNNPIDYQFLDKNLRDLEAVEHYTFVANNSHIDGFIDGRKFTLAAFYSDAGYWQVFDFQFRDGLPFSEDDVEQGNRVAVLTTAAAKEYFGTEDDIVGREMLLGDQVYRVKGLVERPLSDNAYVQGDVFLPVTTSTDPKLMDGGELYGPFSAIFLAETPGKRQQVKDQLNFISENYQMPPEEYFDVIKIPGYNFFEYFAAGIVREPDAKAATRTLFIPVIALLALFILLPLINLINLTISRVFERQAEIGVRKAFGAEPRDILYQFLFENLILTFIGGTIGMVLAVLIITYINEQSVLGSIRLALSSQVILYFILVILLFGLLSGLLPAYRMSKTHVATALR